MSTTRPPRAPTPPDLSQRRSTSLVSLTQQQNQQMGMSTARLSNSQRHSSSLHPSLLDLLDPSQAPPRPDSAPPSKPPSLSASRKTSRANLTGTHERSASVSHLGPPRPDTLPPLSVHRTSSSRKSLNDLKVSVVSLESIREVKEPSPVQEAKPEIEIVGTEMAPSEPLPATLETSYGPPTKMQPIKSKTSKKVKKVKTKEIDENNGIMLVSPLDEYSKIFIDMADVKTWQAAEEMQENVWQSQHSIMEPPTSAAIHTSTIQLNNNKENWINRIWTSTRKQSQDEEIKEMKSPCQIWTDWHRNWLDTLGDVAWLIRGLFAGMALVELLVLSTTLPTSWNNTNSLISFLSTYAQVVFIRHTLYTFLFIIILIRLGERISDFQVMLERYPKNRHVFWSLQWARLLLVVYVSGLIVHECAASFDDQVKYSYPGMDFGGKYENIIESGQGDVASLVVDVQQWYQLVLALDGLLLVGWILSVLARRQWRQTISRSTKIAPAAPEVNVPDVPVIEIETDSKKP